MSELMPMDAQTAVNKLRDHFLGKDYYIVDPVSPMQANAIIVDEIISRYRSDSESPVSKWRRKHKKCRFCKHCKYSPMIFGHDPAPWCTAKKKTVDDEIPKMFCRAFQLKPFKEE